MFKEKTMAELKFPEITVGTIFYVAIGCTSRYPHFYKVIKRTACGVTLAQLKSRIVHDDGYGQNGTMTAIDEIDERGEKITRRLIEPKHDWQPKPYFKYNKWWGGYVWDGKPQAFYTD